jgi:hypothetical protein
MFLNLSLFLNVFKNKMLYRAGLAHQVKFNSIDARGSALVVCAERGE